MLHDPLLRKLASANALTDAEKKAVISLCYDVRTIPRRRNIIAFGAAPEHIHLVLRGWAARYVELPGGMRRIVAFVLPGDFCDIQATTLARMDHGITALSECEVAFIDPERMDAVTRSTPVLSRAFQRSTLIDEAILRQWIVSSGRRDAVSSVAHLLSELHVRLRLVGLVADNSFDLPVTQDEIGDATGLTAVHVNRTFKRLKADGLLDAGGGLLHVRDVAGLRRAARFDPTYLHLRAADSKP